jgi:hypothetical protein
MREYKYIFYPLRELAIRSFVYRRHNSMDCIEASDMAFGIYKTKKKNARTLPFKLNAIDTLINLLCAIGTCFVLK